MSVFVNDSAYLRLGMRDALLVRMTHRINRLNSNETLFRLSRKYDDVRYWFSAYGALVGVWTARNGVQYAVGHNIKGETIVYKAVQRVA